MVIDEKFILETSAVVKDFRKNELIIEEEHISQYFLYLLEGEASVYNLTPEGKEFLQHKVHEKCFFGEPAVLLEKPFPGTVQVSSNNAKILKIKRENFINYLKNNPDFSLEFTKSIAEKSIIKSHSLKNIIFLNPEERIIKQFDDIKGDRKDKEKLLINLTRKELSNMTGLRIETIIRTIKKMEKDGKLEVKNGKVYY